MLSVIGCEIVSFGSAQSRNCHRGLLLLRGYVSSMWMFCIFHINRITAHRAPTLIFKFFPVRSQLTHPFAPLAQFIRHPARIASTFPHLMLKHCSEFCVNIYGRQANQFEKLPSIRLQQISNAHTKSFCVKHILFFILHSDLLPFVIIFNGDIHCSRVGIFHILCVHRIRRRANLTGGDEWANKKEWMHPPFWHFSLQILHTKAEFLMNHKCFHSNSPPLLFGDVWATLYSLCCYIIMCAINFIHSIYACACDWVKKRQ